MNRIFSLLVALFFCLLLIYPIISGDISNSNEDLSHTLNTGGRSSARVAKPVGNGPYSTSFITTGIPRDNNTNITARIYFPVKSGGVDPAGAPYPGIVFAPGAGGYETSYQSTLSQIASWGYIVTIVGTGGPCNQEVVDIQSYVLDYYEAQNSNPKSIFNKNIDSTGYGASGHSNGGWAAIAGGVADPRFKGISPLCAAAGPTYDSGQANTRNLHVPLQLVAGANDVNFLPSSDAYYSLANPIKSYIKLTGSGHGGPFHLEYLISFFRVWLNHDFEYSTFVYGDDVYSDLSNGDIQFESSVGLSANPSVSKQNVYEDEEFMCIGEGVITEPAGPDRSIISYEWDLDFDGVYEWSSNSSGSTNYSYSQNGNFEAGFKVKDSWGMIATASTTITVKNKKPVAMAGDHKMGAEDELISFDGSDSYDTISDISSLRYMWNFGDGNVTTWGAIPNTAHIFTQKGNYTIELMVMDDDGEIASDWKIVT
jgi:hypothetical protein